MSAPENFERLERRGAPRHALRVQVTLVLGCRAFTTYSRDLSLGGLQLEREIPPSMRGGRLRVIVAQKDRGEWFSSRGHVVADSSNRFAFDATDLKFRHNLERWVADFVGAEEEKKAALQ